MGAKGFKVQKITTDFNVQIKFPVKAVENGKAPPVTNRDRLEQGKGKNQNKPLYSVDLPSPTSSELPVRQRTVLELQRPCWNLFQSQKKFLFHTSSIGVSLCVIFCVLK